MLLCKSCWPSIRTIIDNDRCADQAGETYKTLTEVCHLHTVLRLARGMFTPCGQGVKVNVDFYTKGALMGP